MLLIDDEEDGVDLHTDDHLELLCHHPGFERDVRELRATEQRPDRPHPLTEADGAPPEIVEAASKWGVSVADFLAFVHADGETVKLPLEGGKVRVVVTPTAYVLHVPRPLTPQRRRLIGRWMTDEPKRLAALEGSSDQARKASRAMQVLADLKYFDRFIAGESTDAIYASLDESPVPSPQGFRNRLRRVYDRLEEVSTAGLPLKKP